jgi:hypothetical protein
MQTVVENYDRLKPTTGKGFRVLKILVCGKN